VTNPFEDENGVYHVLVNDEGQHSLWPTFINVPEGWTIVHKADSRSACLEFINRNWTDMRPNSLIRRMQDQARQDAQETAGEATVSDSGDRAGSTTRH
jgi:MbtH protein